MNKIVLVCVTVQKECQRLIIAGRDLAGSTGLQLHVLHVIRPDAKPLGSHDMQETLNSLYALSRDAGAEMTMQCADNVLSSIADYAKEHNAACVIVGSDPKGEWAFAQALQDLLGEDITVMRA